MRRYAAVKTWLAVQVTRLTGTMECALFFAVLAVFGFPGPHATLYQYVQWFSTTFLQLVMLPILSAGQAVTQAQQTQHHAELTQMHAHHKREIAALHRKFDRMAPQPATPEPPKPRRDARGRFVKREKEQAA